jgi:hypothetical protein
MEYAVDRLSSRGGRCVRRGHCSWVRCRQVDRFCPQMRQLGAERVAPSERLAGIDASPGCLPVGPAMHKDNASRQGGFRGQICSIGDIGERHRMLAVRSISFDDP